MSWYGDAISGWYRSKIASADAMEAGISQLGSAISKAIEGVRENSIANQIGSQMANSGDYAPRAGLVDPGQNPDLPGTSNYIPSSVPTQGTAPAQFTGGYKGLQLQQAINAFRNQQANTQSEMALRQAQGQYYGAHTQAIQENADTMRQRANTYQQRVEQKQPTDTIQKLNTELSDTYGKAAPAQILSTLQKDPTGAAYRGDVKEIDGQQVWVPNPQGSIFSPNAPAPTPEDKGLFGTGFGGHPQQPSQLTGKEIQVPWSDAQRYMKRYQNIVSGAGQGNQPSGGGGNLPTLSPQQAAQLPPGTQFRGLDGKIYQVPASSGQANAGQ